jgi:hypothetical protein
MLQQDLKQCESRSASLGHGAKTQLPSIADIAA